jgi:hypothetical protein
MNITINDLKIDYALEKEKILGDVIRSLERLATSNGSVIESIALDDRTIPLDEESPEFKRSLGLDLDRIGELRVTTSPRPSLAIRSIGTLSDYCAVLLEKCGELTHRESTLMELSDEILEGAALLREGVLSTLGFLGIRARMVVLGDKSLADLVHRMDGFLALYERRYIDGSGTASLMEIVTELDGFLPKVLKWVVVKGCVHGELLAPVPGEYLAEILGDLRVLAERSLPVLESIAKDLHIGEDRRALENITALSELLDEIVTLFKIVKLQSTFSVPPVDEAADLFSGIHLELKEVEEALMNGDMVTLADSLEYAMKPRFERIIEVLKKSIFLLT